MQTPESSLEALANRVAKLETQNRRLKKAGVASLILAAAVIVMGQARSPKILEAQKIILRDNAGNERGDLFASDTSWGLVLFNKNNTRAASLVVGSELNGLLLFDQNGNMRQTLTSGMDESAWNLFRPGSASPQFQVTENGQGTALSFRDRANNPRVELGVSPKGSGLSLSDSTGRIRVTATGDNMGLASFSEDGAIKWSPDWDKFSPEEKEKLKVLLPKMPK